MSHEGMITTAEAGRLIGIDASRIKQLCRQEHLACHKEGVGVRATYYVWPADVLAYDRQVSGHGRPRKLAIR